MKTKSNSLKSKNPLLIAFLTFAATLGGVLFGYDTAVISGTVESLEHNFISVLRLDHFQALSTIVQYRVLIIVLIFVVIATLYSLFKKLFKSKKATIIIGILLLFNAIFAMFWLQTSVEVTETALSSIKGFTVSSALVGCIIGGVVGNKISIFLGRKGGLLLAALLFGISAIGSALPDTLNIFGVHDIISFIIYRIIGGVGVGLASMLTPIYIAEIAPANQRGKLVSWNQFALVFGMMLVYFVNYFIAKGESHEMLLSVGWRYMFASELVPATLFFVMMLLVPETPRYLILKGENIKANSILNRMYTPKEAEVVAAEIGSTLVVKEKGWLHFGSLLIIIGILLSVFQQFTGINAVLYYAPEIFKTLGSSTDSSLLQTVLVGAINLSFTVVAILTVDKFGRKPLMLIGAIGMSVSMICLGMVFFFESAGVSALILMLFYTAFFAMSWGPVTWVLLSEIFPNSIRGAMSIAVATQWLANLAVSWTFPMMNDSAWLTDIFHHGFSYWIYGGMGIIAAIFIWRVVPETKGKSLEEIEKSW